MLYNFNRYQFQLRFRMREKSNKKFDVRTSTNFVMETHLDMSDNCGWLWAITSTVMTTERGCQVLSFQLEMEKKKLPWALPVEIGRLKKPSRSKFAKREASVTCHLHDVAFHVKVSYANLYQSSTTYSIWRSLFKLTSHVMAVNYVCHSKLLEYS